MLNLTRGFASQNDGLSFVEKGKKPLILFISHENYASKNTLWFYKAAYKAINNAPPQKGTSVDEMVKTVLDFYSKNHWEVIVEMYQGKNFGYDEYTRCIEKYEAMGYEVVIVIEDYMEKMKKKSSIYSGEEDSHMALKTLCQGLFDYNKAKNITFITGHQLTREMQRVADQVKTNVVKHFSADGVSGSIAINQIADLEIYVYIEQDLEENSWLTVQRGKHRYVDDTPPAKRYFAYPFIEHMGIMADIGRARGFVRDIYAADLSKREKERHAKILETYQSKDPLKHKDEPTKSPEAAEKTPATNDAPAQTESPQELQKKNGETVVTFNDNF